MLFYLTDEDRFDEIPNSYTILNISKSRILLNRGNAVDLSAFIPKFPLSDNDKTNKRRYLSQIKDNETLLVMNFYSNKMASMHEFDNSLSILKNLVLVCTEDDIRYFDYMKLLRKFIKKKYGIKVYELTYDITLDMIEESKMSEEGVDRYLKKIMKVNKKFKKDED